MTRMSSSPPAQAQDDEAARLQALGVDVQNQDDLEKDVAETADKLLAALAEENETKRMEKALREKDRVDTQIRQIELRLAQPVTHATKQRLQTELNRLKASQAGFIKDVGEIQERIDGQREAQQTAPTTSGGRLPNESRRDYLLRTGQITPFETVESDATAGPSTTLHDVLADAVDKQTAEEEQEKARKDASHRNLTRPDLAFADVTKTDQAEPSRKRRKLDTTASTSATRDSSRFHKRRTSISSSSSYVASPTSEDDDDYMPDTLPEKSGPAKRKAKKATSTKNQSELQALGSVDDGKESVYKKRLEIWTRTRSIFRQQEHPEAEDDSDKPEWEKCHPKYPDLELSHDLKIPGDIAHHLFPYQKTGVQWLWELHQQSIGGIVGDEMGLGKTVQAITYLAALHHSGKYSKPSIVVCPATLMAQWVAEFHQWWPPFRVSILHSSGSGMINLKREKHQEETDEEDDASPSTRFLSSSKKAAKKILKRVMEDGHVLVTTYSGLETYADQLVGVEWGCAILDEGHKIRNPDAAMTLSAKELQTHHRIILSGTPIQNSLIDLWSLFDFVYPMRLGNLVSFKNQFDTPIRQGGYASATNLEVQTAIKCAETLKDAISPYLLQRYKTDVASDLPQKKEQVIFCKLNSYQRTMYNRYLSSKDMEAIHKGKIKSFSGIDTLQKICNHPDLATGDIKPEDKEYGHEDRSTKLQVLKSLLQLWKDTGHKTLLFAQTVQMLNILEKFINSLGGFSCRRMDGSTQISKRQGMVEEFNMDPNLHVFLMTTRVGGIGLNLTGADRVIIFDPDWNPSTDVQACERAWRLGQTRDVTIFRLMMKGTIEEKIYHRQLFKQLMTNKITKDPQQREAFHLSNLHDLFSLAEEDDHNLETTQLFKHAEVAYKEEAPEYLPTKASRAKSLQSASDNPNESADNLGNISGIANIEQFKTKEQAEEEASGSRKNENSEERLMHKIFAGSAIHAAVEHDKIINGKRVVQADPKMIEAEAQRFANKAAAALRKSQEIAQSVPIGLPTWTGHHGVGGRDLGRGGRGGASSTSAPLAGLTHMPRGDEWIPLLKEFFKSARGPVSTQVLVDNFEIYCTTPTRTDEFKNSLQTLATMTKDRRDRGVWTLQTGVPPRERNNHLSFIFDGGPEG
ncbi:DNA repair protein rhp26 [Penicillium malachiteum]|uniref:DNA repair protein rhp26 n=1 Tax=Penicillium malachiteum TaxID=1324776 RepID=UPI002548C1C2|nr:DNA repair protein rhp26 [Penicillium malachiteum]KAJ5720274.1 DNA repair protein rhp26 [Penicillium malachiteum]